jgi:prolipoprotein diacylglyceryltransferase
MQVLLLLYSAKTIVGGLLGGLLGVEATKALLGERARTGDLYVYPLILAIAVGRIGCFLAGVSDATAGTTSALPWAIDQGDGVLRHPTALYEILVLGALALALRTVERRRTLAPGALFALFLSGYLAWRLAAEFLKPVEPLALGLSAIQWACVLGLLHYARLFATRSFAPLIPPLHA